MNERIKELAKQANVRPLYSPVYDAPRYIFEEDEDDDGYTVTGCDPDEYDGQPDEAQEWADFDADC